MSFDSKAMQGGQITAGDLLGTNPLVGAQEVDNSGGSVKIALARVGDTKKPTAAGKLATVTFKVPPTATAGTYKIAITHIGLADEGFNDLENVTGAQVEIAVR